MTAKQIDYRIELAHTLHFSRVAENMFVSQPAFPAKSSFWRRRSALLYLSAAAKARR